MQNYTLQMVCERSTNDALHLPRRSIIFRPHLPSICSFALCGLSSVRGQCDLPVGQNEFGSQNRKPNAVQCELCIAI